MQSLHKTTRGQSALEYLVTYGWAILGIIIISGVLISFGIFDPARWATSRQQGGFSSLAVLDHNVIAGSAGNLSITLQNTRGHSIMITNVTTVAGGCTWTGSKLLSVDAPATITTTTCTSATVTGATSGSAYDFSDVAITFTDSVSSLAHTERGFIKGQFQ